MSGTPSVPDSPGHAGGRLIRKVSAGVGLAAVVVVAAAGLWAGLDRAGWRVGASRFADLHGYLIVLGFLGTLIGIERALAVGSRWAWA